MRFIFLSIIINNNFDEYYSSSSSFFLSCLPFFLSFFLSFFLVCRSFFFACLSFFFACLSFFLSFFLSCICYDINLEKMLCHQSFFNLVSIFRLKYVSKFQNLIPLTSAKDESVELRSVVEIRESIFVRTISLFLFFGQNYNILLEISFLVETES